MKKFDDNTISILTINDWIELKRIFNSTNIKKEWVYRGQSNSSWHLRSTIDRWNINDKSSGEQELVKRYVNYKSSSKILKSKFYYSLCYLQHYGAPTRLLDVTVNPLIASFFALIDCDYNEECSVYAINRKIFQTNSLSRLRFELNPSDSIKKLIDNGKGNLENEDFLKLLIDSNLSGVFAIKPAVGFQRITRQEGGFLFQGNISIDFDSNLKEITASDYFNSIDECYQKINISGKLKSQILKELNDDFQININYVYPDRNEIYKNLKYEVELEL